MPDASSHVTFKRDISVLPDVFTFLADFFAAESIEPSVRFSIDFAVEEIFTNFVKYNPAGTSGIDIGLCVEGEALKVSLTDRDTAPFDIHTDAPTVRIDQPLQERTPGGLGVHLVKKLMDRVEYAHAEGVSTITLYKNLRADSDA